MRVFVFLLFVLLACGRKLAFHDGIFKIMQITDTHIGDHPDLDVLTKQQLMDLIRFEKPDVVAMTGDLIAGSEWNKTVGWFKEKWGFATSIFVETETPYFLTLGNHDDEGELDREEIMDLDVTNPFSLSQVGNTTLLGSSNYYIPVYNSDNETVRTILWSFDSMGYNCNGKKGYGCVGRSTVEWYRETSEALVRQHGAISGLAFQHIPIREYMYSWNDASMVKYGEKHEKVSCSSDDSGELAALLERGEVSGLFVGHDHMNDFRVNYKGLELAYGLKSGMAGYGPAEGKERGVRMIVLYENSPKTFKTYLRTNSFKYIEQVDMKWTNGTQSYCDGEL